MFTVTKTVTGGEEINEKKKKSHFLFTQHGEDADNLKQNQAVTKTGAKANRREGGEGSNKRVKSRRPHG